MPVGCPMDPASRPAVNFDCDSVDGFIRSILLVCCRFCEGYGGIFHGHDPGDADGKDLPVTALSATQRAGFRHQRVQSAGHRKPQAVPAAPVSAHHRRTSCPRRRLLTRSASNKLHHHPHHPPAPQKKFSS